MKEKSGSGLRNLFREQPLIEIIKCPIEEREKNIEKAYQYFQKRIEQQPVIEDTFKQFLLGNPQLRNVGIFQAWAIFRVKKMRGWSFVGKIRKSLVPHYSRNPNFHYRFVDMGVVVPSTKEPIIGVFRRRRSV